MQPLIVEYKVEWPFHFEKLKSKYTAILGHLGIEVEHVGSTAVPGLAAKDIIDIDIIYKDHNDFDKIKCILETVGYVHHGNQGIDGREVFKRNGLYHDTLLDEIKHHLYVCHFESKEVQRHLLSRNYLIKNDIARRCYQEMKYACAQEANNDRKLYADIKQNKVNHFINYIIELEKNSKGETQHE